MLCQGRTATIRRRSTTKPAVAQPRHKRNETVALRDAIPPLVWVSVISAMASQAPLRAMSVVTERIRFRVVKNR